MSLDSFLPAYVQKIKKPETIIVQEECADCGKPVKTTDPRYNLIVKGKSGVYCQDCGRDKLLKAASPEKRMNYEKMEEENENLC